ncbi:MAG: hypothetical protein RBS68_12590 [Anaerolineales bacterium]|nr:hypothetical protein [Anaerolineales bacterium]
MLNTNLIHEVDLLSVKERVALMEYLARSVQKELEKPHRKKGSSLNRVLGALREKGKPAPTDEEVQNMITDYLIEKYS